MFSVHRSSYKYWRCRPKRLSPELVKLKSLIKEVHVVSNGSAGARSIADMVTAQGVKLTRYRASKIMKLLGLVSCQTPNHRYRKASQEHVEIPNHLSRQFAVTSPNQVWVGDVTYVWTGQRWMYLAVVIDLFARKPIGWAMSVSPDSKLTGKALAMAFESRGKPKGVMFPVIKEVITQVVFIDNCCGVIKSNKAYLGVVIAGITVRWNGSSEV